MILYLCQQPGCPEPMVGVGVDDGLVDLTALDGWGASGALGAVLARPNLAAEVAALTRGRVAVRWSDLAPAPEAARPFLLAPLAGHEVWGAGVTYQISRLERMRESETAATVYDQVYRAERPELFFKSAGHRVVGPGAPIRVRADASWTVPEPELAVVVAPDGRVVGFSLGNDVSARDIEGQNPLYLPQAKTYRGSCAVGPGIRLADGQFDPLAETISCRIERDGAVLWSDSAPVSRLKRGIDELVGYLLRELDFPQGVVLLTGTCLVPPETVSLRPGDEVVMALSGVGELRNPVEG